MVSELNKWLKYLETIEPPLNNFSNRILKRKY